jgi:hypothetical protein
MPTGAYSIVEFCRAHRVSRAFFYVLLKRGDAPKVMTVGRRRLVSDEAAKDWRQRMEGTASRGSKTETGDWK